jgi:AcrR family transcriptional regulator
MCSIVATGIISDVSHEIDDDVLDAVTRILRRDGVRGLTITAIADEANLSRVTLHRRGASIDDFVVAVLARASDDLRASLWPALTATGDAASRLRTALRALCDVAERHAAVLTAFYTEPSRPIPGRPGRTTSFEFIEPFERLLRDGAVDGSLRVEDPNSEATLVANTVCWTYLHMRRAHRWPAGRAADKVITLATAHLVPSTVSTP